MSASEPNSQTFVLYIDEQKDDSPVPLGEAETQRMIDAARLVKAVKDTFCEDGHQVQAELHRGVVRVVVSGGPAMFDQDLASMLETTASQLAANANSRSPRKLEQAVSSPHYIPLVRALSMANVNSSLQGEIVSASGRSPLPAPDTTIFTAPSDGKAERLSSTFEIVGVCRDDCDRHVVVIGGRRFLALTKGEYSRDVATLREKVFVRGCWFEGTIQRSRQGSWIAQPGGKIVIQDDCGD